MQEIGVRELKQRTSEVLRQVSEGKQGVAITRWGQIIARMEPVQDEVAVLARDLKILEQMKELAKEIGEFWSTKEMTVVEAVREEWRDR